ncbi:MAG TPA: GAF domain-containing protein [Blastocatellia bacterium]|nr:GAF domain-containing protein [Blastocatellia bacterium]
MSLETQQQSDKVRIQQYQALLEISEAISSNRDLASLFRNLSQHLRAVVDFDWVSTLLYDPARDVMRIHMLEPPQPDGLIGPAEMPVDDVPSGWAWKTQEPLIIQDAASETHFPQFNRWARQNGVKSYCALPLTSAGRRLGALGFASVKNVVWNDDALEFLTQVTRQVAVAIDNAINFESVRSAERRAARDRDHSQLLLEINNAVASHLDLRELLRAISPCLRKVIYHDVAGLVLYDAESKQLRAHALDFPKDKDIIEEGVVFPMEGTPAGLAFTTRQTVIVRNLEQERFASTPLVKILSAEGVKSGCSVPLITHGEVVGVLTVMSLREEAFSEEDAELLTQIGGQIALAVENALSFDRARQAELRAARERDRISLLLEINNAIVSHLELGALVKTISASLLAVLPHEAAGISLYEPEENLLREYENVTYKGFAAFQKGMAIPLEGTPAGLVFTSGQPLLLKRPDPERFPVDLGRLPTEGSRESACLAPLISHGRKLGILGIGSTQEDRFTKEDLELLTQVADQVAIAVENSVNYERARDAERELARNLEHLQLMLRITNTVVSQLDLKELLDVISVSIREAMSCDTVGVGLYNQESKQLFAFSTQFPPGHPFREKGVEIPLEGTTGGLAFTSGQPVFVDKPDPERFNSYYARRIHEDGYRSGGSIPLIAQGRKLGVLGVASKSENAFSDDDKGFLVQVANQVAIAVDNALNYERARDAERELARRLDHLRLMLKITNAGVSQLDLKELLLFITSSIREVMGNDIVGVDLFDHKTGQLRSFAINSQSEITIDVESVSIPLEGTIPGLAFTTGKPIFADKHDLDGFGSDEANRAYEQGYRSGGVIPLIAQGRKLGTLGFASKREYAYSDDDKELLCQIANQAAIAVDNALNFERARAAEEQAKRQSERLSLMLKITTAVVSKLDLREILKVISSSIREVMRNDLVGVNLFDQESSQLRPIAADFPSDLTIKEEWLGIPVENTLPGLAFTSGQPVFVDKVDLDSLTSDYERQGYEDGYRSGGNIPLIAQGRKLGTLGFANKREYAYSDDDKELLCQIANQAAIAVDNALNFERARAAEERAKRQSERLQLLLDINNAVVSNLNLRELLASISAGLRRVLPYDFAGMTLYDAESGQLRVQALDHTLHREFFGTADLIPVAGTGPGKAFTSRKTVVLQRIDQLASSYEVVQRVVDAGFKSSCSVPLISRDRALGTLDVLSFREDAFTEEDTELLGQIATQIAIAVENSLNFERARAAELEVKRQYDRLRLMLEINNAVVSQLDLRELLRVTASCLREVMRHEIAGLSLYDPDINQLRAYAYDFPDKRFAIPEGTPIPLEGSLGGMAFTSGQAVFVNRPRSDETISEFNKRFTELGVKSGGCVPLIVHGRKLGVLGVASIREDAFPEDQQELLAQVAAQIAIAVDNALNFERARKAEQEVRRQFERERLMLETNNAVVTQLDLRELVRAVSSCLREVLQPDVTGISLYDHKTNQFRAYMFDLPDNLPPIEEGTPMPLEGSVGGLAFLSGRPVFMSRPDPAIQANEFDRRLIDAGIKSGGVVPLIAHDRKLGFLGVGSFREDAFSEADQELLGHIANQIAIAVENALNFERARAAEQEANRQSDRLQLLLNLNNAIASALDLPALFRAVSASLRHVFHHDFAIMGLFDEQKRELRAYTIDSAEGLGFLEEGMLVPLDGTPPGLAISTKQVVIIGPGDAQKFSSEFFKRAVEHGLRSSCTAPMLRHNRVIGAISIVSKTEAAFTPNDGELFLQIAGQVAIAVENALAYREIDALKDMLTSEKLYLEDEIRTEHNFEELIGASPSFKRILKQVETVAPTDSTVLIRGETGTGKELIARAIHSLSVRKERTLVKINCAAIPSGLLESEIFGHEKGAFTGAISQRIGRFELANKGTLFLDEIGDIPVELQPKLLRVLQEQEFERLGSTRTQKVDVRLIAATNADLEQMVADKKYRSDLYYRLNVFPITVPPLRERPEDIPALTRFFTQKYARRLKKRIEAIPADVMTALSNYRWPGNVRELEHFIERAVVLTQGPDLEVSLSELKSSAPAVPVNISTLEDAERGHIVRALDETNWVIGGPNGAAARLGMKRTTLQSKMQKLGISRSK